MILYGGGGGGGATGIIPIIRLSFRHSAQNVVHTDKPLFLKNPIRLLLVLCRVSTTLKCGLT